VAPAMLHVMRDVEEQQGDRHAAAAERHVPPEPNLALVPDHPATVVLHPLAPPPVVPDDVVVLPVLRRVDRVGPAEVLVLPEVPHNARGARRGPLLGVEPLGEVVHLHARDLHVVARQPHVHQRSRHDVVGFRMRVGSDALDVGEVLHPPAGHRAHGLPAVPALQRVVLAIVEALADGEELVAVRVPDHVGGTEDVEVVPAAEQALLVAVDQQIVGERALAGLVDDLQGEVVLLILNHLELPHQQLLPISQEPPEDPTVGVMNEHLADRRLAPNRKPATHPLRTPGVSPVLLHLRVDGIPLQHLWALTGILARRPGRPVRGTAAVEHLAGGLHVPVPGEHRLRRA